MLSFHCPGMTHITNLTRMPRGAVPCESGYWKFEKWKVKWKSGSLISRSEKWNENLVHSFREWKVKWKCLDIEIESEKWNENVSKSRSRVKSELKMPQDRDQEVKFPKKSRKFSRNNTLAGYCWIQTIIHTEDTRNRFCHASLSHKYSSLYWIQTIIHIENTLKQFRHPFLSHWEG